MPSFSRSRIAAKLQNTVAKRREEVGLYQEIAEALPLVGARRLLDVGTDSGLQLKVIHEMEPNLELFGLDVSEAAIRVARANLEGIEVDLHAGSICGCVSDHWVGERPRGKSKRPSPGSRLGLLVDSAGLQLMRGWTNRLPGLASH